MNNTTNEQLNMNDTTGFVGGHPRTHTLYHTVLIIVGLLIIVHNVLVIYLYFKRKELQNETNYLLTSLAHADLLTGLLVIPTMVLASRLGGGFGIALNILYFTAGVSNNFVLVVVSLNLVLVILERYMSLCQPYLYPHRVSNARVRYCSCTAWIASIVIAIVPLSWSYDQIQGKEVSNATIIMYYRRYSIFIVICFVFIPSAIMLFALISMFRVVRRLTMMPNSEGVLVKDRKAETKALFVFLAMFLSYLICWSPLMSIRLYDDFNPGTQWPADVRPLVEFFVTLRCLSALFNPGIYVWWKVDFRRALLDACCIKFTASQENCGYKHGNRLLRDSSV